MPCFPIDRRAFLRRTGWGVGLTLLPAPVFAAPDPAQLVARRIFFENPEYRNVKLSHDGLHLAYFAPLDGVKNLWVAAVDRPHDGQPVTRVTDRDIGWDYRWAHTNQHLVFLRDHEGDENWRAASVDLTTGATVPLTPERGVLAFIQESDHKFPDEMLFGHNQRDKRFFDIYRINLLTGHSELLFENHNYYSVITDGSFRARLAGRVVEDGSMVYFELRPDGNTAPLLTIPITDIDATGPIDFSEDGNTLYLTDSRGRDRAVLAAYDMTTKETTVLAADDEADITRAIFVKRRPVAALAVAARNNWHPLDDGTKQDLAALAALGPGDPYLIGYDDRRGAGVAYIERDTASGVYALLDPAGDSARQLFVQHKALDDVPLRPMEPVSFAARDGLRLNGYLTRPAGEAGAKVPLMLVIHGGPYARDQWGFNSTHQWLANRGYAVLSINYRGSTGFGKAFVTAADHEWGGKMHDDLIDGLDWALAQGFVDPARIGFYGGSYGGYSALMAATKTPERFTCIIDLFGVSNLITFMATIPPYWNPWFRVWKLRLGDPDTEAGRAFLTERSPLNHLEHASKPILIAQGLQDVRVVAAESEQMVAALAKRDVPVTYVTFADEGHGFVRPENRLAFAAVAEAFLAKHLGGRVQPVGNDFAGSSIKITVGRDLIPGLPA
jgi:dipeptidyl aminopeptidase/acylaminoacyl peptidase